MPGTIESTKKEKKTEKVDKIDKKCYSLIRDRRRSEKGKPIVIWGRKAIWTLIMMYVKGWLGYQRLYIMSQVDFAWAFFCENLKVSGTFTDSLKSARNFSQGRN